MDSRWQAAADLAEAQHGLVTRAQCLQMGVGRTSLDRRIQPAGGRWQRVLPGVYATFTGELSHDQRCRAGLLLVGSQGQLAGRTALQRYGLRYLPVDDGLVHVLVPIDVKVASRAFVRVHRTGRTPPAWVRGGLPVSPPEHAAILASRDVRSLQGARAMLAEVVQRRLTTLDRLQAVLDSGHSAGSALPRRVLVDLAAGCRSAPECELRDLVMTRPALARGVRWNHRIRVRGMWLVADACWPELRLVVEVDSIEHHGLGDGPERTARRRAALVADGWVVLSVSPRRIREQPEMVLAELEAVASRAVA